MKLKPLISVVLPVYNVDKYIANAIDSILNQTIQDFEILVIDDCSTDNTILVAEACNDNRIKIIRKERNLGLIHSLNLGFSIAKGKYIARMDGDDINVLNRFEKQVDILETNPNITACGSWLQCFDSSDRIIKHKQFHHEIVAKMLIHCSMSLGGVMLRVQNIKDTGIDFNTEKLHVEDYDFWSRVAWSIILYNIQEPLYYYRVHSSQVSNVYNHIQVEGEVIIKLYLFKKLNYDNKKYSDSLIKKMLLLNTLITTSELSYFLKWLKSISRLNKTYKIYSQKELDVSLRIIKEKLFRELYFKTSTIGLNKKWRIKSLFKMGFLDVVWVLKLKGKEIKRRYIE